MTLFGPVAWIPKSTTIVVVELRSSLAIERDLAELRFRLPFGDYVNDPRPSVILVDDHHVFLDGLTLLFKNDGRMLVLGAADCSRDAILLTQKFRPDVVILDVDLDDTPVMSTMRKLFRASPLTRVIILTMHRDRILAETLLHAGATTYLTKTTASQDIIEATYRAALIPGPRIPSTARQKRDGKLLTPREREVLRLIGLAQSNKQIGEQLSISVATVKHHASDAYRKLGAISRMDAVHRAQTYGILYANQPARSGTRRSRVPWLSYSR